MLIFIAVFIAGGTGSILRFAVSKGLSGAQWTTLPLGTATVNILGCLLFGIFFTIFELRTDVNPIIKAAVLTGFLGGFTTFSSYMAETVQLLSSGVSFFILNMVLQTTLGGAAFWGGTKIVRVIELVRG
ncbi:MAG: CrcB family protein [Deltaproteobacteria bacterium]|nr:CrcB family protein [Deltaproteobacteria bacterium]